jgi:RNA methyltransferase, TrmH family
VGAFVAQRWSPRVIGASPDGSADLHRFDYPRPTILVLGEERNGLTPLQRDLCSSFVRIPMVGVADSLNLAVAGSLLMYEVYRAQITPRQPADAGRSASRHRNAPR